MAEATQDTGSEAGTVSSSGLEDADVVIYFHRAISDDVTKAEKILKDRNVSCCLSYRDLPAGRLETANIHSASKHCPIRVYIMTKKFLDQELKMYGSLLGSPEKSTKENTLFITSRTQRKKIPLNMRHFSCKEMVSVHVSATEIADFVSNFIKKHAFQRKENRDPQGDAQDQGSLAPYSGSPYVPPEVDLGKYENQLQRFNDMFGKPSSKRGYVLVASAISRVFPGLESIASIPWLRVFDFDPKSRAKGLLSAAEPLLKATRHHTKTDALDEIEPIDDKSTNWVFINGYSDNSDTLHRENQPLSPGSVYNHSISMVEHCQGKKVPTTLVMWYTNFRNMDRSLDTFLSGLQFAFTGGLGSFTCIVCVDSIPEQSSDLYAMLKRLNLLDNTLAIPLEVLCKWFETTYNANPRTKSTRRLPKYQEEGEGLTLVDVDENQYQWISVHFDLLAIDQNTRDEQETDRNVTAEANEGVAYLKGAEVTWNIVCNDKYVVERDFLQKIKEYVETKYVKTGKSGVVTIFHSPGGGGTTFSRRLLWSLRETAPCAEMKSSQVGLEELKNRLLYIRNLTSLPTVLLVDGYGDHDVKKIMEVSRSLLVVVLHVQRYYKRIEQSKRYEDTCFLHDRVTANEADKFCEVYSGVASPPQKSRLVGLTRRIKGTSSHCVFEYGLTAFQTEFRGVRRYVHGYLQIKQEEELQDWHTVLAFLSIANYYGHRGLPSRLFSKILKLEEDETVETSALPHPARQFMTEDEYGNWKITHYIVSMEILEQILVKRSTIEYETDRSRLTPQARELLCDWAERFIQNIKDHLGSTPSVPGHIYEILTSIYLKRYYNDPGEKEVENKSHYSRLVEDMQSSDKQRQILQKLVNCFPNHPEFHAHLGRLHYKQARHDEAEKCLGQAVKIRKAFLSKVEKSSSNYSDDVLERIYNMFGFCCNSHVRHTIGATLGNLRSVTIREKNWPSLIRLCLEKAGKAIENFENGRKWHQKGSNPTFAYLGEIKVRLHLTELAKVMTVGDLQSLQKKGSPYKELGEFVMNSFHECDQLLAQCIYQSSGRDIPEEEMNFCANNFQRFFYSAVEALERWAGDDSSVKSKRCHVSILKMHLKRGRHGHKLNIYDDVKNPKELDRLIALYEGIFDDLYQKQNLAIRISNYMMEWLQAIRHPSLKRRYTQLDVLSRVKKWDERKEAGSLATFYRYVLTTVLAMYTPPGDLANTYSVESAKLKDQVQNYTIPLYLLDKSAEWLGSSESSEAFGKLLNLSALSEWNGKFWSQERTLKRLQVCSGTIHSCKVYDGRIVMDGGQRPSIFAFFVPQKYAIGVSHSKQKTRVEFYLGFNPRHRAEAFEVRPLKTYPCPSCRSPTEVSTLGKTPEECMAQCRRCEAIVSLAEDL